MAMSKKSNINAAHARSRRDGSRIAKDMLMEELALLRGEALRLQNETVFLKTKLQKDEEPCGLPGTGSNHGQQMGLRKPTFMIWSSWTWMSNC